VRILFITSSFVGEALLTTGVLKDALDRRPGAAVTVVAGPASASLFDAVPGLDRVIAVEKETVHRHWWRLWRELVRHRWDLVIDFRRSPVSRLLMSREWRWRPVMDKSVHRVVLNGRTAGTTTTPDPYVWTAPAHEAAAARLVPAGPPVLALATLPPDRTKSWPAERFVALARRLTAADGLLPDGRVLIVGGPGEEEATAPIAAALADRQVIDTTGRLDLLTNYAVLRRCALFIGVDSGPMHIAAAAGIPTLGLFGPTYECHFAPWTPRGATVRGPGTIEMLEHREDRAVRAKMMPALTVDAVAAAAGELWQHCADMTEAANG
jgi:ADP-heptose:LPS heptosyltransferase